MEICALRFWSVQRWRRCGWSERSNAVLIIHIPVCINTQMDAITNGWKIVTNLLFAIHSTGPTKKRILQVYGRHTTWIGIGVIRSAAHSIVPWTFVLFGSVHWHINNIRAVFNSINRPCFEWFWDYARAFPYECVGCFAVNTHRRFEYDANKILTSTMAF